MKNISLVFCIIFISSVFGHDWMITPPPRGTAGATANTVSPCEAVSPTEPITTVTQGKLLTVEWANGHQTGDHSFSVAKFGQDTQLSDFKVVAVVPASKTQIPQYYSLPPTSFGNFSVGDMITLRYSWQSWDNCATLRLAGQPPSGATSAVNVTTNPVTNQPTQPGDYLLQDGTKTVGTYNEFSDKTTCVSGYVVNSNKQCVAASNGGNSDGMSPGGKAALAFFFIGLFALLAFAGYSYHKTGHVLGLVNKSYDKKNASTSGRSTASYVAFTA